MTALADEPLPRWEKRMERAMRACGAGVDDVTIPFWHETMRRSAVRTWTDYQREKLLPVLQEAIFFVASSLWEPGLTDEQWAARLREQGWDFDITAWDAHWTANLTEWHWGTDGHGQARRYVPIDPLRPDHTHYVTVRRWLHEDQLSEITYPLDDQPPPPGEGWQVMPKHLRSEWKGRTGWCRPAIKPKDYERYHRALVGLPRTLRDRFQIR
jgi:hypothetical protein